MGGASSTNPVTITTLGSDTNVGLTITSKGTGAIIVGNGSAGVDVKGGSTGFRVWDDNSSHYYQFVTGDRSANYNINLPAGDVTLVAGTMITSAGGTFTGQLISTLANNTATGGGQLYLNGATGNRIDFNTNGVAAPAFTTRSAGTKIVLFPNIGAAAVDYAIGIESGNIWSSVATTANGFKWYGGTTVAATLTGAGELTLTSNLTVSGGTITTGNVAATVLGGNTTTNIALGGGLTSGTFTLGGTATTGTITLDQSNSAHTLNIATGTNASGVTKTVNIGTNGASGSTTNVTIGAVAGSGTTVMYGNVGVGTTSPSTWGKFAVVGAASGSQVVSAIVNTSGTVNTQAVLSFDTTNNGFNVRDSQIRATNNGANQTTLEFYTANAATPTKKMQIGADGVISLGGAPGAESLRVTPVASAVNYVEIFGAVAGVGGVAIKSGGSDTNITTYYSAKGNGGHIFQSNSTVDQFRIAHTASAVDFLQVTGSASGFPSLSATGATANASIVYQAKGAGGHSFNTNNALQFQISHTASAVNYLQVTGGPTVFGPEISAQGTGTDLDLYLKTKGTGSYVFYTNSAVRQFQIAHTASAVNYLQVTGATTGNRTSFSAAGSDTNVGINYNTKGAEFHVFTTSSGAAQFVIAPTASAVNQVYATGGTTGNGPTFSAQGPDTNISISLTPKGTGGVGIGINSVGYKLDVAGKGRFLQDSAATTGAIILRSNSGNTVGGHIQWVNNDNSAQLGYIAVDPSTNMTFATGGNVQMSLLATGYNGFGLAAPTAKIHGFYSATIAPSLTWNSVSAFNLRCEASELTAGLDNASPFNYYLQARNSGSAAKTLSINPLGGNVVIGARTDPGFKLYVNGSFAATTKSFVIDHPTKPNMKLRYGSLEGPENGVYVRGRLTDSNTIELPDYWTGLVDEDSITVNLTAIGAAQDLYVVDITDNTVIIGGENVNCFYTVFAERKDVDKLVAEFE